MTTAILFLEHYLSPTLNQWERLHRWARATAKTAATDHAKVAMMKAGVPDLRFEGPVRVEYVRVRQRGPDMDEDNLAGSFKAIGDALQRLEVVANDRDIRLSCSQRIKRPVETWGTILTLTEAGQ